jgi:hypothetical protein
MACEKDITGGFSLDCNAIPTKGIVQSITLMNRNDIDRTATVFNVTNEAIIEDIVLKSGGKQAYLMDGVKNILNAQFNFVPKDDTFDGYLHTIIGYIADLNPVNMEQLRAFTNGAEIVAIVNSAFEGADGTGSSKYKVYGYEQGMVLTVADYDANENGGLPFTISNKDGYENPQAPHNLFITDLATTEALVTGLLTPTV